ncbi:MAG: alpha-xylosidase [Clostridia bacterium]|nr:alpha-xylosidase [Clostridia bacterium]
MLPKHLIPKTSPKANQQNIVFFENYRITVLGECLFRIESDSSLRFNDSATQQVWFRNIKPQSFSYEYGENQITIITNKVTLTININLENSYVIINGKKIPLRNDENLLGTSRTLDCYDGKVSIRDGTLLKLENGVCSKSGVALLDDTHSLRLDDDGNIYEAAQEAADIYVFAYGNDYRGAVRGLYSICGAVPMLPRYAFGNWWSRYHAYTDKEYIHLLDEFDENGIPLTVATLDMDWHYSDNVDVEKQISAQGKNTEDRGCLVNNELSKIGWTGYSWNKNLFPDYKAFIKELKSRNLKITLNLHPANGVRYYEDMYVEMADAMGIDPSTEKAVRFDISDPKFIDAYFKILHHPYERDGVDFWWIDWQQGTSSDMPGLDPLWALNHYHYLDNKKSQKFPLIMSRYAGIGSHRYPIGFSGDTTISWETLELMPYFTATATNIGYTWWGHDIGGHHLGKNDSELYLRFLQFGVFNPINRMHCTNSQLITKEPWCYENGIGELAKKMLCLRHRLIPFLYTCNYLTHTEGLALCEPMYYGYPECRESYEYKNQYIFGQSMIVAPITEHSDSKGLCRVKVWLPEGQWTDFFTGDVYRICNGGKEFYVVRPLDSIPVFVKEGGVIVMSKDDSNCCDNPKRLEAKIYKGNGDFSLYENNETGEVKTKFTLTKEDNEQKVIIRADGEKSVIPNTRTLEVCFENIIIHHPSDSALELERPQPTVTVTKDGKPYPCYIKDYARLSVIIENFTVNSDYVIIVKEDSLDSLTENKRSAIDKLKKTQSSFSTRDSLLKLIKKARTAEKLYGYIYRSTLEANEKLRLTETIMNI